jgi:antitoxin (DNA-binding transcriptional repressor) of toxin-antitoxin stability system
MKQFGSFEAKTYFSEILGEVIKGESFVITKHGVKVAMIIPFTQKEKGVDPVKNSIRAIKKLRKGITLGKKLSVRKMREEGRK